MATISTLVARIEARIALASGVDVQAVDEPRFLEMLRHKYNTLFDKNWWTPNMVLGTYQTTGTTGEVVGDLTGVINRFEDVHSIFYNQLPDPLPILKYNYNPTQSRRPCFSFNPDPSKLITIYPIDTVATVNIWYRTRMTDAQWEALDNDDTVVNFDDEALILGVVADYLTDDGSNPDSVKKYEGLFNQRVKQLETLQFNAPISKRNDRMAWPTQWYSET